MNKLKSLKLNMLINSIRSVLSILFPIITFRYSAGVLGVNNIGKYTLANSIVSYFVMIAELGIEKYAIREGAVIRESKSKVSSFIDEIFTLNFCSTLVAYVLFVVVAIIIPKLSDYRLVLFVLSLQICFKFVGVEWIYTMYEDFLYITIRSFVMQLLSLVLLVCFVKTEQDLIIYALIHSLTIVGVYFINYYHSRKYHLPRLIRSINIKKHFKPIIVLFAMNATIVVYVASDITILGFLCDDYTVGIYSVSTKIYSIIKTLLSAILVVSIPRLSMLYSKPEKKEFNNLAYDIYKTLLALLLPAIIGMIMLREEIILFISNKSYIRAKDSFFILSIALFFCMMAWFWGQCVLIPMKKEWIVFKATVFSAIVNIVLNVMLIPYFGENAAALTTTLSELIAFVWCWKSAHNEVTKEGFFEFIGKVIVGCFGIILSIIAIKNYLKISGFYILVVIFVAVVVYFSIEVLLKNDTIVGLLKNKRRQ